METSEKDLEMEKKKEEALRRILTPEARLRLNTIKMIRKDYAEWIEYQLIHLASLGQLDIPLSDSTFKEMILSMQEKKEIKIRRGYEKNY